MKTWVWLVGFAIVAATHGCGDDSSSGGGNGGDAGAGGMAGTGGAAGMGGTAGTGGTAGMGGVGGVAPEGPNIVFVTSSTTSGDTGGLAGADTICNTRASEAGLDGNFIAFLSTTTQDADARLAASGARGWVRVDGKPVLDQADDPLWYPVRVDETGTDVGGGVAVWTGLRSTVILPEANCTDWTVETGAGVSGFADAVGTAFHQAVSPNPSCSELQRLYCFQTDYDLPVTIEPETGRYAFFADVSWDGFGGLDRADSICQSDADTAGLSGTYLAALSTTTATARSRFNVDGATWVRPDGLPLAATAADVFDAALFDVPLNLEADGTPVDSRDAWGPPWLLTGASNETCANWTGTSDGLVGRVTRSDKSAAIGAQVQEDCGDSGEGLYCLQE